MGLCHTLTKNTTTASYKLLLDIDSAASSGDSGTLAVLQDYHAGLLPPFCLLAVKSFFDAH
jgi:hypothetical protein